MYYFSYRKYVYFLIIFNNNSKYIILLFFSYIYINIKFLFFFLQRKKNIYIWFIDNIIISIIIINIISTHTYLLLEDPNVVRSPRSALNHRKSLVGFHWGDFLVPKRHFLLSNVSARPVCCWLDCFQIPLRYQFFLYLQLLPLKKKKYRYYNTYHHFFRSLSLISLSINL